MKDPLNKALLAALRPKARLLLAVSGGKDSVALLHACSELGKKYRLELELAHVDHGIRKESRSDADFVRALARRYGLTCHVKRAGRRPQKANLEDWGREVRYGFFAQVLKTRKLEYVLTAHTANDQAETLLMRLLQNREFSGVAARDEKRKVLRPFLCVQRSEIERYVRTKRLSFVEDSSNADLSFLRNRIRHRLLPYISRNFSTGSVETLSQRATALGRDCDYISHEARRLGARLSSLTFGSSAWLKELRVVLAKAHEAVVFRLLGDLILKETGQGIGRRGVELLVEFIHSNAPKLELAGGLVLKRNQGGLLLHRLRK